MAVVGGRHRLDDEVGDLAAWALRPELVLQQEARILQALLVIDQLWETAIAVHEIGEQITDSAVRPLSLIHISEPTRPY